MRVQITHADGAMETWESHSAQYNVAIDLAPIPGLSVTEVTRDVSIALRGATQIQGGRVNADPVTDHPSEAEVYARAIHDACEAVCAEAALYEEGGQYARAAVLLSVVEYQLRPLLPLRERAK